jgi:cytochrome c553
MTTASIASVLLAASSLLGTPAASAQLLPHGDPVQGRALAERVCAACHGGDGNSVRSDYPNLAGQGARYLYDQLLAFKAQGHRRASGVMGAIAVNLGDAEMRDVATYFATQRPRDTAGQGAPMSRQLLARGESIYRRGIAHDPAVPACASCHALAGIGLPPEFPRLAGQHQEYLAQQLDQFRADRRNSNANQMMSAVAHRLSERDIQAVAGYIARMR